MFCSVLLTSNQVTRDNESETLQNSATKISKMIKMYWLSWLFTIVDNLDTRKWQSGLSITMAWQVNATKGTMACLYFMWCAFYTANFLHGFPFSFPLVADTHPGQGLTRVKKAYISTKDSGIFWAEKQAPIAPDLVLRIAAPPSSPRLPIPEA